MAVYAITLAFCNPRILTRSIEAFHRTRCPDMALEHFIIDQHYPLHRNDTLQALDSLEKRFHVKRLDPGRNLGLHHGINWALENLGLHDDDIVIGYDGDSVPLAHGWDRALVRAIESDSGNGQRVVWSSLANPRTVFDIQAMGFDQHPGDPQLWLTRFPITNSICAWRYGWLRSVGFLTEPRNFYGHLEAAMFEKLRPWERWAVLPEFPETDILRRSHDREYTAYKWHHSHTQRWPGDFESFVDAGCPGMETAPLEIP